MKKIHHLDTTPPLSFLIVNNNNDIKDSFNEEKKTTVKSITKFKKIQITVLNDDNTEENENVEENLNIQEKKVPQKSTQPNETSNSIDSDNDDEENKLCKICFKQFSVYTCPRCHIGYCSSICFKSHNSRCSNEFFEQQVKENLHLMDKVAPKDSLEFLKRMKKIYDIEDEKFDSLLSKFNLPLNSKSTITDFDNLNYNDYDDDNEQDIDISNLNIDEMTQEQLLSLLTPEEIEEFNNSIKDGTISNIIEEWVPWWNINIVENKLNINNNSNNKNNNNNNNNKIIEINEVEEIKKEEEEEDEEIKLLLKRIPKIYSPIQPFSNFSKQPPSKSLFYHLIDIVYSYCYLMRTFNGEWNSNDFNIDNQEDNDCILDGCTLLLDLSSVLKPPPSPSSVIKSPLISFNSIESVLNHLLKSTHSGDGIEMKNNQGNIYFSLFLLQDVITILEKKDYTLSLVSHCYQSFDLALNILKLNLNNSIKISTQPSSSLPSSSININELKKEFQTISKCYDFVKKKLFFFLSWINEEQSSSFQFLSSSVNNYFENEKLILLKK
ncbi:hypothetical protein RB653_004045 [Dictyostelium firmibasis]|uniref:HIT-type domain-containing protein n=1 Tax=Dictyostelium firmibasis TaxID=79012 RepID=A0AAN7U795_9MYCE